MAERLGMEVVAEGVETHEQLACVREMGIPIAQGYLFSPAQPVESILLQGLDSFEQGLRDRLVQRAYPLELRGESLRKRPGALTGEPVPA